MNTSQSAFAQRKKKKQTKEAVETSTSTMNDECK